MKMILVVCEYYLPGYKGGGPIRSIENMVDWLGDEYAFYILTRDRDLGDEQPYPLIRPGAWNQVGKARVRYLAPHEFGFRNWVSILNSLNYDLIYLNSFFAPLAVYTLVARRLGRLPDTPLLLAPRGELFPGALQIRKLKKQVYLAVFKLLNMVRGIHWQGSTDEETDAIRQMFPKSANISTARNLNRRTFPSLDLSRDVADPLRLVFISRISPKKGLDIALRILAQVKVSVEFDIYGPQEDPAHWQECQRLIAQLPAHIHVAVKGAIRADQVVEVFSDYHGFLFPTRSENFGHVIWESLFAGCLPIISDRTPWLDLDQREVGWVCDLDNVTVFLDAIQSLAAMDVAEFQRRAETAHEFAVAQAQDAAAVQANRIMLENTLGMRSSSAIQPS